MEQYPLDKERIYFSSDVLTLECEEGPVTRKISDWLQTDPVRIHKMVTLEKSLQVDQNEVFIPLVSKLRRADFEYYKRITGLNILIDFPGFPSEIKAKIPFDTEPVAFYKWWRKNKNEHRVHLSRLNQYKLFSMVYKTDPKVILKKDIDFIKSF